MKIQRRLKEPLLLGNDDSFGSDSRIEIDLTKENSVGDDFIYYVAVTAAGNDLFNPEIEESGSGGQSQGAYQLSIKHVDKASSIQYCDRRKRDAT